MIGLFSLGAPSLLGGWEVIEKVSERASPRNGRTV